MLVSRLQNELRMTFRHFENRASLAIGDQTKLPEGSRSYPTAQPMPTSACLAYSFTPLLTTMVYRVYSCGEIFSIMYPHSALDYRGVSWMILLS